MEHVKQFPPEPLLDPARLGADMRKEFGEDYDKYAGRTVTVEPENLRRKA